MDVTSSEGGAGIYSMRKAMDVQKQQLNSVLEGQQRMQQMQQVQQQNQQMAAQKTGIGANLNILG
jgi:membrane protease subunit (stomatin/prohibitin family)